MLLNSVVNSFFFFFVETILLYSNRDKHSVFTKTLTGLFTIIQSAKTSYPSFEKCYTKLGSIFCALRNLHLYYHIYQFLGNIDKT